MTHSSGSRSGTRYKFAKGFRARGLPAPIKGIQEFKVGSYVDIKADAAIQRGMPHGYYHGKTGKVFAVTRRAIGVYVRKTVKHRQILKMLYIRTEHARLSNCKRVRPHIIRRLRTVKKASLPMVIPPQEEFLLPIKGLVG